MQIRLFSRPPGISQSSPSRPEAGVRFTHPVSQKPISPSDQFIRFGAEKQSVSTIIPVSPKPYDVDFIRKEITKIKQAIQNEPGAENLNRMLEDWRRFGELGDQWLVTTGVNSLEHILHVNEAPVETINKALDSGLQTLMDEAIERKFNPEIPRTFFVQQDIVSFHQMGHIGSAQFIPILDSYLKAGSEDQKQSVFGALSYMAQGFNPETAKAARQLLRDHKPLKLEMAYKKFEDQEFAYVDSVPELIEANTEKAVNCIATAWERVTTKEKELKDITQALKMAVSAHEAATDPNEKRIQLQQIKTGVEKLIERNMFDSSTPKLDTPGLNWPLLAQKTIEKAEYHMKSTPRGLRQFFVAFMKLANNGAPGAMAAIEARKTQMLELLNHGLQNPDDHDFGGPQVDALLKAALFGQSIEEVPPVMDFVNYQNHQLTDLQNAHHYIPALSLMAKRGIAGASELKTQIQGGLDAFVISQLEIPLKRGETPEGFSEFSDSLFRYFYTVGIQGGSAAVIPAFERVLSEPWAPINPRSSMGLWKSSGDWYTEDKTQLVRNQKLPQLREALRLIKERLGIPE